jgi:hypothetical protein
MITAPLLPQFTSGDAANVKASQTDVAAPNVGDLWMLAWDGADLGLVVVSAMRQGYVLVWPVTDTRLAASSPSFYLDVDGITVKLIAWPEAEAGISTAVLSHRIRPSVLSGSDIRSIYEAVRGLGTPPAGVQFVGYRDDDDADDALNTVCLFASAASDIEWTAPAMGISPLSADALKRSGVTMRDIASMSSLAPAVVRNIFEGKRVAPSHLVASIAKEHHIRAEELLGPIQGAEVRAINTPVRKAQVVQLAARRGSGEAAARALVWEHSQRAARSTGQEAAVDARVDQALGDLLGEIPSSDS